MKRLILAAIAAVALSTAADAANCATDYKDFWDQFNNGPGKALTGDKLAIVSRSALRAYEACNAGDESGAGDIFKKLQEASPARADEFWKQLQDAAPAKK